MYYPMAKCPYEVNFASHALVLTMLFMDPLSLFVFILVAMYWLNVLVVYTV